LDDSGTVIYIDTFTKLLFTSLRLGFVILPESLVDAFAAARFVRIGIRQHSIRPCLQSSSSAEFILEGYFGHHIRHMRQVYAERCRVLVEAVKSRLPGKLDVRDGCIWDAHDWLDKTKEKIVRSPSAHGVLANEYRTNCRKCVRLGHHLCGCREGNRACIDDPANVGGEQRSFRNL
jgi:hypothetical protein